MRIEDLESLVALARFQHFGRAATYLNLSQPTLSRRIECLEQEVGVKLLERKPAVVLTEAGTAFLECAQDAVSSIDLGVRRAQACATKASTIKLYWFTEPYFNEFFASIANSFSYKVTNARRGVHCVDELIGNAADVAFYYDITPFPERMESLHSKSISCTPIGKCSASLVMSKSNPIASKARELTTSDLAGMTLIAPGTGSYDDHTAIARRILGNPEGLRFRLIPKATDESNAQSFASMLCAEKFDLSNNVYIAENPLISDEARKHPDRIVIDHLNGDPITIPTAVLYKRSKSKYYVLDFVHALKDFFSAKPLM